MKCEDSRVRVGFKIHVLTNELHRVTYILDTFPREGARIKTPSSLVVCNLYASKSDSMSWQ